MAALGAQVSNAPAIVTRAGNTTARASGAAVLVTIAPPGTYAGRVGYDAALVVYAANGTNVARVSDSAVMVVYSTATPVPERSLAWTFTLDGHCFYVLDLGEQGTFLIDMVTLSWCKFETQGGVGWNVRNGTQWTTRGAPRVVGGDSTGPYLWELDPLALFDDGFRDIAHAATAGIVVRSRVYVSMSELRIAASAGLLDDTTGAAYMQLTYSDDGGQTYVGPFTVQLLTGATPDGQQDIRFPSLGAFMAPGRVLQIADVGGTLRLDGISANMDDYDGAPPAPQGEG